MTVALSMERLKGELFKESLWKNSTVDRASISVLKLNVRSILLNVQNTFNFMIQKTQRSVGLLS